VPAILDPLENVSVRVVQPESIRRKAADRRSVGMGVDAGQRAPVLRAGHVGDCGFVDAIAIAAIVFVILAEVKTAHRAGACRIFPFGFGRQTIDVPGFAR
jgi:hypothetical protein